jgi:hypothetical protein
VSVVDVREAIARAHHEKWARVVAALTRRFGDLDIAEEEAAEAFATAVERWPIDGVPPNPGGRPASQAYSPSSSSSSTRATWRLAPTPIPYVTI